MDKAEVARREIERLRGIEDLVNPEAMAYLERIAKGQEFASSPLAGIAQPLYTVGETRERNALED